MTAVNIFVLPDQVRVWTNGACVDADGVLVSIDQKVGLLPHLNAVIAVRGPAAALAFATFWLGSCHETFDGMVDGMGGTLSRMIEHHSEAWRARGPGVTFELLAAGFSESRRAPEVYWIESSDTLEVRRRGDCSITPSGEEGALARRLAAEFPGMSERKALSSETVQLRLMDLQRETEYPSNWGERPIMRGVGGFAQLTTVFRDRIATRVVKRWPDRIGEKIGGAA